MVDGVANIIKGGGWGGGAIPTEKIVVYNNSYSNIKILLNFRYQREMARHRRHQREARQKWELQPPFFHYPMKSHRTSFIQRPNCAVRTRGLFYNHLPLIVRRSPELEFLKSLWGPGTGGRGIGLSYRPARLHRLGELIPWNQFRGPINI